MPGGLAGVPSLLIVGLSLECGQRATTDCLGLTSKAAAEWDICGQ
jgi:hypothetical protein